MKSNNGEIKEKAKKLVSIAKEKNLIKSHMVAFKEFPVEEVHKGESNNYK